MRALAFVCILGFVGAVTVSCKKDDPVPLKSQTNGVLLAGAKNQSKEWKVTAISIDGNTQTLPACYSDNVYTFSNNAAQDYAANEGSSVCGGGPNLIEAGTWSFTEDGLILTIVADETYSTNGLFSPEPPYLGTFTIDHDDDPGTPEIEVNIFAGFPTGYPYPAFVNTLTETDLVLEINNKVGTGTYKFVLTLEAN